MDEKSILRLLTSDNDLTNITEKDHNARQMGIKAVPMFMSQSIRCVRSSKALVFGKMSSMIYKIQFRNEIKS